MQVASMRFSASMIKVRTLKIVGNEYIRHELYVMSLNDAVVWIVGITYTRRSVCSLSESNLYISSQRKVA